MKIKMIRIFYALLVLVFLVFPNILLAADWSLGGGANSDGDFNLEIGIGSGGTGGFGEGFGLGDSHGLPDGSILGIIENILFWLLAVVGIVSIIGFAISGLLYLTAAGDSGQIDRAKNAMTYSIIGVIVSLAGFVVIQAAFFMLSAQTF